MSLARAPLMALNFRCDRSILRPELSAAYLVRRDEVAMHLVDKPIRVVFASGERFELSPHRLMVSWGAMPHRAEWLHPDTVVHCLTLPLAWVLRWQLTASFNRTLLACRSMVEPDTSEGEFDRHMLHRWVNLLKEPDEENRRIVLLEAEARLRRFARAYKKRVPRAAKAVPTTKVEEAIKLIAEHFTEPLAVPALAGQLDVHPDYLSRLFRQETGQTLSRYLAEYRLAHSCALLVRTTDKIIDVAYAAGFGSVSQFNELFRRYRGCSPREYRVEHRAQLPYQVPAGS